MNILPYILMALISFGISSYIVVLIIKVRNNYFKSEIASYRASPGSTIKETQTTTSIDVEAVSAGSASKTIRTAKIIINGYRFSDDTININNFILLLVCGSSMKNEDIEDNDVVMVEQCSVDKLKRNNIILVKNQGEGENIKHKLRKYIGVFDGINIQDFAQNNDLVVAVFQECYNDPKAKNRIEELQQQKKKIVVSETSIEEKNYEKHYSFHSDDLVEGVVKYAIPNKYIEVIKKN